MAHAWQEEAGREADMDVERRGVRQEAVEAAGLLKPGEGDEEELDDEAAAEYEPEEGWDDVSEEEEDEAMG